ncbi:MAG: sulfatase-like hydrolase/transferase [Bacteroidales bacterium]
MADDHAYQAISAYDSTLIHTPNIDRLANEGMRFDQAFVTNSICSPSRAVILTGKHSHLNGVRNNMDIFDSTQQTFPKLLQQSGYETAIVGKWHLKSQPTGFDFWNVLPGQGYYYKPQFKTSEGVVEKEGYVTNIVTDISIDWLEERKQTDKPFMLMIHHKAPHREWLPPPENLKNFKDGDYPEPPTLFDDYVGRGTAANEAEMRIQEHMGYTNDNKVLPHIMNQLGLTEFSHGISMLSKQLYKNDSRRTNALGFCLLSEDSYIRSEYTGRRGFDQMEIPTLYGRLPVNYKIG